MPAAPTTDPGDASPRTAGPDLPVLGGAPSERADAARNRRRILEAAERLVAERGIDCVSMEAVAAEANVGKGTVFRRFGDRAGLARALVDDRERRFQESFIRGEPPLGPGAPPVERLVAFGRAMFEVLEGHAPIIAAAEAGGREAGPWPAYRAHVAALIREADPVCDADYFADVLLGALRAGAFLHARRVREMSLERLGEGWETLVRRLLA